MASVTLQNVTKVFDRHVVAVSDLTLDVPNGQFMALVGPSGCGKTTTLRLIAGLEKASAGEIRIEGKRVDSIVARDRNVAMVFQDGGLYPHMDVMGNMAFALRMRGCPESDIRRRVQAAAQMLGIGELLSRKPGVLSGGQRRRVALGRAIVREPAVFLFDEPLSHLDAQLHLVLRRELKELHRQLGTTTLYVTHDQAEAMALGERIGVLREGRLQQVGTPEEIYDRPANRFVAGFFGSPPMNFLDAQVQCRDGSAFLVLGDERLTAPAGVRSHLSRDFGKAVRVGVRPHDLSLESLSGETAGALSGAVTAIEMLGSRKDVHVALRSGSVCVITAPPHACVRVGEAIRLYVAADRLHVFEHDEAGRNITG